MFIDTHAHVNFAAFKDDYQEVFQRTEAKQTSVILVGSQRSTSERAVELAQKFNNVYASVGLHPIQLEDVNVEEGEVVFKTRAEIFDYEFYKELAKNKNVVAIGEVGLDYYHFGRLSIKARKHPSHSTGHGESTENIETKQKENLLQHIKLANELDLPIILHCRGDENEKQVYEDLYNILKENLPEKRGVLHSFTQNWKIAEKFLDLGFYLGFNGIITFDKTGKTQETLENMPLDKVLTETDCPYLAPVPMRGKRNEPNYVEFVNQKIAEIRNIDLEVLNNQLMLNSKDLFNF